ncbi:DUF2911 domain-containing protein [candidate division KSB1 bacterium]|nr:DUF2911 domain-containing protein [candidate division KSB1 bacterium]
MKARALTVVAFCMLVGFWAANLAAQNNLPFIRVSPQAQAVQYVGFAKVEIDYSRPGVKGREIWGELVPYGLSPNAFGNGKPMPWRAGANENTTITFSHDAKINGNPIKAGKYGVHMIVGEDEWTVIFSNDYEAWGSFFYEKENDALRINVKPEESTHEEWMMFGFDNLNAGTCEAYLKWGEVRVPFTIEFDHHNIVLDTYRHELKSLPGFNQAAWGAAARYCMQNNVNLDEGTEWIDKALSMNNGDNFNNLSVKAGLLTLMGKEDEGNKLLESSLDKASEAELNVYGYQLMGQDKLDEAIKIFKLNIKKHPESWNVYDSLGEALSNKGDKKASKKNYEKAYSMAPDGQKARIEGILKGL